jgi:hypothetical protein
MYVGALGAEAPYRNLQPSFRGSETRTHARVQSVAAHCLPWN